MSDFSRYFQTFEGGYAEGDLFVGVMVPDRRAVAKKEGMGWTKEVLASGLVHPCHEVRHTALFALLLRYHPGIQLEAAFVFPYAHRQVEWRKERGSL